MTLTITPTAFRVTWVLGALASVLYGAGAQAVMSASTGTIMGRSPTVTPGMLVLRTPDNEVIVNHALMPAGFVPHHFIGTTELLDLPEDDDDDGGLSTQIDTLQADYFFTANGTPLTPYQLGQPLGSIAPGGVITAKIVSPVIVSSTTGSPKTATTGRMDSQTHTFRVDAPLVVRANGFDMPEAASFPGTGFDGAEFEFLMNGVDTSINSTYTYSNKLDKTWFTVNGMGHVMLLSAPAPGDNVAIITITDSANAREPIDYRFTPKLWMRTTGINNTGATLDDARTTCNTLGSGYRLAYYTEVSSSLPTELDSAYSPGRSATRMALWDNWGALTPVAYPSSGITPTANGFAWADATDRVTSLNGVVLGPGGQGSYPAWNNVSGAMAYDGLFGIHGVFCMTELN
ncbi:hypothetical protein [Yersinia hibernica]|uniref:Invasin n=1 Tax=Yersinia enterocolitica LC20 TaxID=1443113 RepID=A0A7U4GG37_YEREN|nr:hypothetical protein [Yersinia hibernica]AHM74476.2 hypothetical protein LC20_03223 [Yersinia hibernica]